MEKSDGEEMTLSIDCDASGFKAEIDECIDKVRELESALADVEEKALGSSGLNGD